MKSVQSSINGLEAWVQEELLARRRMLAVLERRESAVKAARGVELEECVRAMEAELDGQARRDEKRARLFAELGAAWSVAPSALTLSSIGERARAVAGGAAERLLALRDELEQAGTNLVRKNRRVSALMNAHQRVIEELLGALVAIRAGDASGARDMAAGGLVDAEA